jgi:excisionase family DNA binding protein
MIENRAALRARSGRQPAEELRDVTRGAGQAVGAPVTRGLLRVEEAAEWLGLSRTKAYELVYRGVLPSVTIGRSRRVPVAALQTFVDELMKKEGLI